MIYLFAAGAQTLRSQGPVTLLQPPAFVVYYSTGKFQLFQSAFDADPDQLISWSKPLTLLAQPG